MPPPFSPVTLLEQGKCHFEAGRVREAIDCLEQATDRGLPEAALTLARMHRRGLHPFASTATAMQLFEAVAEKLPGVWREAAELHFDEHRDLSAAIRLLERANAVGDLHAQRQLSALSALSDNQLIRPVVEDARTQPKLLAEQPLVRSFSNHVPPQICQYIIDKSNVMMRPSTVVHPITGLRVSDPVRTSKTWSVGYDGRDVVVNIVLMMLADCCGKPLSHGERLSILQYNQGEQYKHHHDYLNLDRASPEVAASGQRTDTAILYLNDGFSGGETEFRRLGLAVKPAVGCVLHFRNVDAQGSPEPLTLHAGLPVLSGVKWAATLWIRERPYQYPA